MSDDIETITELISDAGFETYAWIENIALDMLDVTKGFDHLVCPFESDDENLFEFVDTALSSSEPVFLFVHLFDVHKPYLYTTGGEERHEYNDDYPAVLDAVLPNELTASSMVADAKTEAKETVDNYDNLSDSLAEYAHYRSLDYLLRQRLDETVGEERFKYLVDMYRRGVEKFDRGRLADLLETIRSGLNERYLLTLTSDHGEAKCEWRGRTDFMNSFNVSEGATRIPWIFETDLDGLEADLVAEETPVSHVDFYPTIADVLAESTDDQHIQGCSLIDAVPDDRQLFTESWYYEGGVNFFGNISEPGAGGLSEIAIREGSYKFVRAFEDTGTKDGALYHVDDISEDHDISAENPRESARLEKHLDQYLDTFDPVCEPDIDDSDSDMLESRLRALGYIE
jgi:arylsulfatase A-like enzyme